MCAQTLLGLFGYLTSSPQQELMHRSLVIPLYASVKTDSGYTKNYPYRFTSSAYSNQTYCPVQYILTIYLNRRCCSLCGVPHTPAYISLTFRFGLTCRLKCHRKWVWLLFLMLINGVIHRTEKAIRDL